VEVNQVFGRRNDERGLLGFESFAEKIGHGPAQRCLVLVEPHGVELT